MERGQYIIISVADLNRNLELLKKAISGTYVNEALASFINFIESNPADLYGIVGDAYKSGMVIGDWTNEYAKDAEMNDYLNTLEI